MQFLIENDASLLAQMADEQYSADEHEAWLKQKVDDAFARLHEEQAVYLDESQATERMNDFKAKVRAKYPAE
ncbi:hypothetical protein [Serratia rubidaea]|uniref:hypothetical protein n=1 Tax=Serratia rubidaea TaxID=61652 RepID=UPI00242F49BC|nr:hypothetical protein [Serratia rubidaea]MCR0999555.1 hypothetical protein [Serratia rubidaea]